MAGFIVSIGRLYDSGRRGVYLGFLFRGGGIMIWREKDGMF